MIEEVHRPDSMEEALALLARSEPRTLPLGGGSLLSRMMRGPAPVALVDLQRLGLDRIVLEGGTLRVGATVRLEQLSASTELPEAIADALRQSLAAEAGLNIRQMATAAGTLVGCDGRSPFVTALLALDPRLVWAGSEETEGLGDYLALRHAADGGRPVRLLTEIRIPVNASLRFESVARTPLDRPVVCVAVGRWKSGRTRVALGGYGKAPVLAMDGPEGVGAGAAAQDAYLNAGDEWASAEYRAHAAGVLAKRLTGASESQPAALPSEGEEE